MTVLITARQSTARALCVSCPSLHGQANGAANVAVIKNVESDHTFQSIVEAAAKDLKLTAKDYYLEDQRTGKH